MTIRKLSSLLTAMAVSCCLGAVAWANPTNTSHGDADYQSATAENDDNYTSDGSATANEFSLNDGNPAHFQAKFSRTIFFIRSLRQNNVKPHPYSR